MLSNEVKSTISASWIFVFQVFIGFAIGNVIVINRGIEVDSFKFATSMCNRTSAGSECKPLKADIVADERCFCWCPYTSASLVFHNDKWTCLENRKVRELQGKNTVAPNKS